MQSSAVSSFSLRRFVAITCVALGLTGCGVNTIPTLDEQVNAAWAQVENQYKRRADLIPNLVETVKGYATHEKDTLTQVIEARAKATSVTLSPEMLSDPQAVKRFEEAQGALSGALSRLMAVSEQYPQLKANENFLALQSQLEGTENRITVARQDYIQTVQRYNTEVRTFPGRLWAMIYGAKPKATFTAPAGAENAPAVKF
jgi:LemA protein